MLVVLSCTKVTDEIDPQIIIESPVEFTSFNLPDTMLIKAVVSDDNNVESIKISVTDENFVTVFGAYSYPPSGNPTNIEDELVIDDVLMESGIYYLKIRVYDGENSKNAFRKIYINEVPRELENVIVITKNAGYLSVQNIDAGFSLGTLFNIDCSYEVSEISARYQLLYIAGKYYDWMKACDIEKGTVEWTLSGVNHPPLPYFRNLYFKDDLLYVSTSRGEVLAYNQDKIVLYSTLLPQNRVPGVCIEHDNFLVTETSEISGFHSYLTTFFATSGSFFNERIIDMDVIGLYSKGENRIYCITNTSLVGGIYVYNPQSNGLDEVRIFEGNLLIASEQIDDNNLFLAFSDGVHIYNYNLNSLTLFVINSSVLTMSFDDLNNILYIAESNRVSSFTYPQGTLVNSIDVPKDVVNMHLHYNK